MEAASFDAPDRQVVQGYRPGGFTVSGVRWEGSVLVMRDRTLSWGIAAPDQLVLAPFEPLRANEPKVDLLIVGTGARSALFPPALRQALRGWGIVVEAMATPAACRTYNVLLAEERRVAAALIALPPEGSAQP
ncbi:MAG TPA: Mth938-like domain-containing protein [Geminicoccaceae bacterium]|nr:Mth938-like domain-containing protein [Geminicoccaceae bacterium]